MPETQKLSFDRHADAERLKIVARGLTYNGQESEAVAKHTLLEVAMRLETGGYEAPSRGTVHLLLESDGSEEPQNLLSISNDETNWTELALPARAKKDRIAAEAYIGVLRNFLFAGNANVQMHVN